MRQPKLKSSLLKDCILDLKRLIAPLFLIVLITNLYATAVYSPAHIKSGMDLVTTALYGALTDMNVQPLLINHLPGSSGDRATSYFIDLVSDDDDALLLHSSSLLLKNKSRIFDKSFHDLEPVARLMVDYSVLAVRTHMSWFTFEDLCDAYQVNTSSVIFGGGSVINGMDHLISQWLLQQKDTNFEAQNYIPYRGGGEALAALRNGTIDVLSTSLSEVLPYHRSGQVRILCTTAPYPIENIPVCVPGAKFENWRGLFAKKDSDPGKIQAYKTLVRQIAETPSWLASEKQYGWVLAHLEGDDFKSVLVDQYLQFISIKQLLNLD